MEQGLRVDLEHTVVQFNHATLHTRKVLVLAEIVLLVFVQEVRFQIRGLGLGLGGFELFIGEDEIVLGEVGVLLGGLECIYHVLSSN